MNDVGDKLLNGIEYVYCVNSLGFVRIIGNGSKCFRIYIGV